jgi:hypothetical protein
MNKYLIVFLIIVLIIIYFLKKYENENENFNTLQSQTNLLTVSLGIKYTIIGRDNNKVELINFPTSITPAVVYTLYDNIKQQNYYYIYNHGKIMTYINGKVYFNQSSVDTITSPTYSYNYKLYKTSDNKLYYFIGNTNMYLTANKNNYIIELELTTDPKLALTWEF